MHRREYDRFEINALVILVNTKDIEKTFVLKNLSGRGAAIIGNCPLEINNILEIVIQIPFLSEKPIRKEAKIVWCKKINDELWREDWILVWIIN